MKRALSFILSLLMLFGTLAFASCSNGTTPAATTPAVTQPTAGGDVTDPAETTVAPAVCPVAEEDYDGHEFLILEGTFSLVTCIYDFTYQSENPTILDDAVFKRNSSVEDRLNVTIASKNVVCKSTTGSTEGYGVMMREKTAGDTNYDAVILPAYDQSMVSYNNANYDLNKVDTLDLSNAWWDQMAVESLEIKGMQFFTTGDFSIDNFNSTIVIAFNKGIAKEKSIPDLYQLVNEGKWTLDKWKEYCLLVYEDLNGDEKFTDVDRYGSLVWDDAIYAIVNGAGERCCVVDDNGDMVLTLGTEGVIGAFKDYTDFVIESDSVLRYQHTFNPDGSKTFNAGSPLEFSMFPQDLSLFLFTWLGVTAKFRDMDTDYGILPVFKYTETQENYYCTVAPYNSRFMSMPYHQEDADRTGIILETIGYYSQQYVRPAYYDKMLYGSIVRDEESRPMLDLIYANRVFDIGYYYQPANINKNLLYVFRADSSAWASKYNSLERVANVNLKKWNDFFTKLANEG
ncbi:MAG: hypothetical protein IIW21_07590 [Clostridia bacterium]|nr:hypothetical protein [Clostridia bacterium]